MGTDDEVIPKKDVEMACIEIRAMTTESGMIRSELVLGILDRLLKGVY